MFENKDVPQNDRTIGDLNVAVQDELTRGRLGDDETRLAVLEELYRSLERQLEGDLHQEAPPRF